MSQLIVFTTSNSANLINHKRNKNIMKIPNYIPMLMAFGASISSVAAVTIVNSDLAPTENVVTSFEPGASVGYAWRDNTSAERDLGQSFLAESSFTLDSFSFLTAGNVQFGASGAAYTVTVYEGADITEGGSISLLGSAISTQTGNFLTSGSNPVSGDWLIFDVDNVSIVAGHYYTLMLSWDTAGIATQEQVFAVTNPGGYANGRLWEGAGASTNYTSTGLDLAFTVQSIPELSSFASIIGVLSMCVVARRRRLR